MAGYRGLIPLTCALFLIPCTEHLASQPLENEFQVFNQNVSQPDFACFGICGKTGLHKQARERPGEPLGKRLNIFRPDFFRLGVGNPGLQLCARSSHRQRGKNRWPAKQNREPGGGQHHPLNVGALQGSLEITRFSDTVS